MYILNLILNQILVQQPTFTLPPGQPLTLPRIYKEFLEPLANFLIAAGVILAIIALVVAGIMYFRTPSEVQAKLAKAWFKNGLIGAVIILGVGVIINTVALVVTGGFFGFRPGGGGGGGGGPGPGAPGATCVTNNDCGSGTTCSPSTGICVRPEGNVEGEPCKNTFDCRLGLECKRTGIFGTGPKQCKNP